jgi:hypothetical protein
VNTWVTWTAGSFGALIGTSAGGTAVIATAL